MLHNLLTNAIKFTRHGKIIVKAKIMSIEEDKILEVEVVDEGIGMSWDEASRVFDG